MEKLENSLELFYRIHYQTEDMLCLIECASVFGSMSLEVATDFMGK